MAHDTAGGLASSDGSTRDIPRAVMGRWVLGSMAFVLAGLLAIAGVCAQYVRSVVLDTDRYVDIVEPIGRHPAVQHDIAEATANAILAELHVDQVTADALAALVEAAPTLPPQVAASLPALAPALARSVEDFVRTEVDRIVMSEGFADFWREANRTSHRGLVTVLTGTGGTVVAADAQGTVTVALGPIIDQVAHALVERGLTIAESIPPIDEQLVIFHSSRLAELRRGVALLDLTADVLLLIAFGVGALGVLASPRGRRRRAATVLGIAIAGSMVLLGLAVSVGRSVYLGAIPTSVLTRSAAEGIFDPVVEPLRAASHGVLVVGLAIAVAGYLTGGSRSAGAVRRAIGSLGAQVHGDDRNPSAAELWIGRHRRAIHRLILGLGALLVALWRYPTGMTVTAIAVGAAVAALAVSVAGSTPAPQAETDVSPPRPRAVADTGNVP